MIRTILIDDEKHCTESLAILLSTYCPTVQVLASVHEAEAAVKAIHEHQPDLLFLDINMPRLTGLQLVDLLGEQAPPVVFTTAYDDHAVEAFRVGAIDYLMKPIHQKDLMEAVRRAEKYLQEKKQEKSQAGNKNEAGKIEKLRRLPIYNQDGITFIPFDDIIFCKSESNYTQLVTVNGQHMLSKTLKEVEEQLQEAPFLRIHNSYVINMAHLQKYVRGVGGYTVMTDGHNVPVSKSRKQSLLQAIDVQL